MVQAIVGLADVLGLGVTAEGMEHEQQATLLRGLRCGRGQGYLFARPLPAAEVEAVLARPPAQPPGSGSCASRSSSTTKLPTAPAPAP